MHCGTDGHWSGGSCKAETCHAVTPEHAAAPVTGDYGRSSYALQCLSGYYPHGTMRCVWQGYGAQGHGEFEGATCDECDAIQRCPISLGGLSCTHGGDITDSTCSHCEDGYTPTEPTPTACIGRPCEERPFGGGHGHIVSSSATPLRYPSTISFRCDAGYVLSNKHNRTCTTDGGWSSDFPICIETCELGPCRNGATCTEDPQTRKFQCACPAEDGRPFWEGDRCEVNVNECTADLNDGWSLNGGCDYDGDGNRPLARCINETGGFRCGRCLGSLDCCHQADAQDGGHELPCGGSEFNTQCSVESGAWTELGCIGPATAHDSTFVFEPTWFVAGGLIEVRVTPHDVNNRLSADNGITSASDLRGLVHFACLLPRAPCMDAPSQTLGFAFNSTGRVYIAQHPETTSATYRLNVSVHDQLGDGPHWKEIHLPTVAEFHVVPAPADASHTIFGGCYFGTSSRLNNCYCVEDAGDRHMTTTHSNWRTKQCHPHNTDQSRVSAP